MQSNTFSDAALILLGHGTALNDQSAAPVFQHAGELRRQKAFTTVREAFWKQEPHITRVLEEMTAPRVFIVPFFISEGYFSTEIIPRALGFQFPDRLSIVSCGATWHYCRPVGSHDLMTNIILARASGVVKNFPFPRAPKPQDTALFIAGHGTRRNANSRLAIERQVERVSALNLYAEVSAIFMEEAPYIQGCQKTVKSKYVVIVPFFISDGLHVVEDIPVLLGEPAQLVKERLEAGHPTWRNPTERHGKLIWYSPSVGTDPLLADVILERVREAAK